MKRALFLVASVAATLLASSASARTLHYQVTVTVTGSGHVTAPAPDSTSGSIDCPGQCSALMKQNTTVTFTATPDGGAPFNGDRSAGARRSVGNGSRSADRQSRAR